MWGASCEQGPVQGVAVGEAERYGSPASQPAGFARQGESRVADPPKWRGGTYAGPFQPKATGDRAEEEHAQGPGEGTQASASRGLEQQGSGKMLRALSGTAVQESQEGEASDP